MRVRPDKNGICFHPFEIAFSGFSGTGKTTLIEQLITSLSNYYDIGYFKHDAHKFNMDREGKDTWKIQNAGAKNIFINDPSHSAELNYQEVNQISISSKFIDSDFLFIEGHKFSQLPKILVINNKNTQETIKLVENEKISNILAIVTEDKTDPFSGKYLHFQREQINEIQEFIIQRFKNLFPKKINGLILSGGKSLRMKEDKGSLIYHQTDQITHTKNLISPFCEDIYVSCKEDQKKFPFLKDHTLILDSFPGGGPSTGILSAQNKNRDCAWLVIGCDLPYLDKATIHDLVENRNPFKLATCFMNPKRNWPEPICTIYEPKSYHRLIEYFSYNKPCPRKVLFNSNINALTLKNIMALENVNTPDQKEEAIQYISKHGENYEN